MNLEQAKEQVNKRPITAWMAWGVVERKGDGYVIVGTNWIKKFGEDRCVYIRKGEAFPKSPFIPTKEIKI